MKRGHAILEHPEIFEESYGATQPVGVALLSYDAGGPDGPRWWVQFPNEMYTWVDETRLTKIEIEADYS